MKFDRDLFISYAHIDNESLVEGQDGWVSTFHRGLEIRLAQLRGEKPRIWRDQKLQGNDDFSDTILEQFPNLALLVSILSPRYVKSTWCLRELEHFANAAEARGGLKIGDKVRIFKVIKTHLPRDKHPQTIDRLLGYDFFDFDEAGRPREFSHLYGLDSWPKFVAKIEDLAYDINKTLDLLEALPETNSPAVVPEALTTAPEGKVIYLAETTPDLSVPREKLRRELEQGGHRVLPDQPLPNPPDFAPAVDTYLAQSALSVHLLSPYAAPAAAVQSSTQEQIYRQLATVRTRDQIELAKRCGQTRPDFARILWLPPDANISTLEDWVQALQNEPDFISTNLESLKDIIRDRLTQPPAPALDLPLDGTVQVYLDCDERDLETSAIEPLYNWLEKNFHVVLPDYEDSSLTRSEALIKQCEAVLIYYGEASGLWLKRRLLALKKTLYGRPIPLRAKAIYAANPARQRFTDPEVPVIEGFGDFRPDLLNVFLEQLA
jgi:hypothetical protein